MSPTLDEAFRRAVSPGPERILAGVALAAAGSGMKDGQPQVPDFLAAYGTLRLDPASAPVSTNSIMWLASCSKLPTTIAALQCVERGLFDLDSSAHVDRLLPEWRDPQILAGFEDEQPVLKAAKEKITLRQLLTHTSGLEYDFYDTTLAWRKSRGEVMRTMMGPIPQVFTQPLLFEPGTGFAYGPSIDLVGLMVARANDCSLEEYMRKNIFDPLGMNDTSFRPRGLKDIEQRLMPMTARPGPGQPLIEGDAPTAAITTLPLDAADDFGGAGLFGTAEDYLKLLKSILRNDGQLLKPSSIDQMFTPSLSTSADAGVAEVLSNPIRAQIMIPGDPAVGTPGAAKWSHGLGGIMCLDDKEYGMKAPWIQWGGAPNLKWWIDRTGGSCGIFATQLSPPGEKSHQALTNIFQEAAVRRFTGSGN